MEFNQRGILSEHKAAVYALCAGDEDHIFYSGGSDRFVIRWNLKLMEAEKVVSKSPTTIVSLCYLKSENLLLIGQVEGGVHVIDLVENKEVKYLKVHKGYIFDIQFIKEKNELVFSSGDGSISIWSVTDFKFLFQMQIGKGKNRKVAYSPERKELAIASADGFVQVLNTEDWSEKFIINGLESGANSLCYLPDKLIIGTKNAHLHQFDLKTSEKANGIAAHNWAIYDLGYNENLDILVSASRDKTVKIWNPNTLEVLKRFEGFKDRGHTHSVNAALWSRFNDFLITAGDDKVIRIWECQNENIE
ncbi:MAG: WD40 repeat protein [Vicingaceae bacterium]|jgi:WD40 repeat protein